MNNLKKSKAQRGITLVALIITIVVLLILALVTINAVRGDGIIGKAQKAKEEYQKKSDEENTTLEGYLTYMKENSPGGSSSGGTEESKGITWTDNGNGTFTSSDGVTVEIGDYVDYNEGSYTHTPDTAKGAGTSQNGMNGKYYILETSQISTEDLSWRVLGVNSQGQLELISAAPTSQEIYLANDDGYVYAEENLNNFCNDLYGKGTYAAGARSLKLTDIDKLTHYDPKTYSSWYGTKWIYKFLTYEEAGGTENWMRYSTDGGATWNTYRSSYQMIFRVPEDKQEISSSNPGSREVVYSLYAYSISNNLTTDDGYTSEKITEIINMFDGVEGDYWLASPCADCASNGVHYYILTMRSRVGIFFVGGGSGGTWGCYYGKNKVRPIVSLASNVSVTTNGEANSTTNMWTLSNIE